MFEKIRQFFTRKKEPEFETIEPEEVLAYIEKEQKLAEDRYLAESAEVRKGIPPLLKELRAMVDFLGSEIPDEEERSPKLQSVVKSSLPLFKKTMLSHLQTKEEDDPEEFYHIAAELIKGLVTCMRGPGRYIHLLLPEEMKDIRMTIDSVGRQVNDLTKAISDLRKRTNELDELRSLHSGYQEKKEAIRAVEDEFKTIKIELEDQSRRVETSKRELERYVSSPEFSALSSLEEEHTSLKRSVTGRQEELETLVRCGRQILSRAAKAAERSKNTGVHKDITKAMELLPSGLGSFDEAASEHLTKVVSHVFGYIEAGDLTLKNMGEEMLFQSFDSYSGQLRSLIQRRDGEEESRCNAERSLVSHPSFGLKEKLEGEISDLSDLISHLIKRKDEASHKLELLKKEADEEYDRFSERIRSVSGETLVLAEHPVLEADNE